MRLAIVALILISMVGCIYPLFANASVPTIDLVVPPSID
jgi:hypothetical protein